MKKVWKNEEGVSPVIAVILMVAITVVLAAVLYVMVSGMLGSTGTTPTVSMNWNEDPEAAGVYTGNVVSISGVSSINTDDVTVTVTHSGTSGSKDLDKFATEGNLTVLGGGTTLQMDFNDQAPIGKLGAEDTFSIAEGDSGDTIRLVYKPTSGQMVSTTLT
ncbi:MAG: type IV pilin N-terminal domain-containing protein [Thermoplasmata archaeon]|nr:MAG: type IV pilin N-terminal domain-containing protein [Thermoplasmata archaeon]